MFEAELDGLYHQEQVKDYLRGSERGWQLEGKRSRSLRAGFVGLVLLWIAVWCGVSAVLAQWSQAGLLAQAR